MPLIEIKVEAPHSIDNVEVERPTVGEDDALALALMNEDNDPDPNDPTVGSRKQRPLYPPGQYPCSESMQDLWFKCWTAFKRTKCARGCWRVTCKACVGWLAKESRYMAASPRIVHAFAATSLVLLLLAIITAGAGSACPSCLPPTISPTDLMSLPCPIPASPSCHCYLSRSVFVDVFRTADGGLCHSQGDGGCHLTGKGFRFGFWPLCILQAGVKYLSYMISCPMFSLASGPATPPASLHSS